MLIGFFVLDAEADTDGSERRESTFMNAHHRLALFTGRDDPGGRDEQYERLYVCLVNAQPTGSTIRVFEAGLPEREVEWRQVILDAVQLVAERNPDDFGAGKAS